MMINDEKADAQRRALEEAIKNFYTFLSFSGESRFAVPGESDIALDRLHEVFNLMYGE